MSFHELNIRWVHSLFLFFRDCTNHYDMKLVSHLSIVKLHVSWCLQTVGWAGDSLYLWRSWAFLGKYSHALLTCPEISLVKCFTTGSALSSLLLMKGNSIWSLIHLPCRWWPSANAVLGLDGQAQTVVNGSSRKVLPCNPRFTVSWCPYQALQPPHPSNNVCIHSSTLLGRAGCISA